jgi:hypothetical protein
MSQRTFKTYGVSVKNIQHVVNDFLTLARKNQLEYLTDRIDFSTCSYLGWVNTINPDSNGLKLDLNKENHRFLLFVLSSIWSASGPWENSAYFVKTIVESLDEFASPNFWKSVQDIEKIDLELIDTLSKLENVASRKKISFRKDVYSAIIVIASNWRYIEQSMISASKQNDWSLFINDFRAIDGTAPNNNKILIKLPLIFRELRCQNIFNNISGELCCVQDERVVDSIKYLKNKDYIFKEKIMSYRPTTVNLVFKASKYIYQNFGDLYDIPLFSLPDVYSDFSS